MKKNVSNNHMLNKILVLGLFFSYLASGQTITDSVEKKDGDQPENKLVESDRELELMKQAELSKNGIIGNPTNASVIKGRKIVDKVIKCMNKIVNEMYN